MLGSARAEALSYSLQTDRRTDNILWHNRVVVASRGKNTARTTGEDELCPEKTVKHPGYIREMTLKTVVAECGQRLSRRDIRGQVVPRMCGQNLRI